jgi:hypothetical protein
VYCACMTKHAGIVAVQVRSASCEAVLGPVAHRH